MEVGGIPFLDPEEVVQGNRCTDVEDNVRPNDAVVAPPVAPEDLRPGKKLVCIAKRAVAALVCGRRILQLSWCLLEERCQVLATSLAGGRVEDGQLTLGANNCSSVELRRNYTRDPVSKDGDAPHEYPKPWQCTRRLQNSIEECAHQDQKGYNGGSRLCIWHSDNDHVSE